MKKMLKAETLKAERRSGRGSRRRGAGVLARAGVILFGVWCAGLVVLGLACVWVGGFLQAEGMEPGPEGWAGGLMVALGLWPLRECRRSLKS